MAQSNSNGPIRLRMPASSELEDLRTERAKHQKYRSGNRIIVIALVLLILSYLFSVILFVVPDAGNRNLAVLLSMMQQKASAFFAFLGGNKGVMFRPALVRYTVMVLSGAALASAGCVFQGSFRNIIASPTTMGVQSGASLGNALYVFFFSVVNTETVVYETDLSAIRSMSVWELNRQQLFAITGALIAIVLVVGMTNIIGKNGLTGATILFSGMVFSSFAGAITTLFQYYFMYKDPDDSRWRILQEFNMGNFDKVSTTAHLAFMALFLIPCLLILLYLSPKLNVLVMGEDEAKTMGVNVLVLRNTLIGVGTAMSASVFAFCGGIGFVGFIVPQICRPLVGPDFRKLLPMTMVSGGILMIWVYNLAFALGYTMYLNAFTSILGCGMMIYSFLRGKGGRSYA